MKPLETGLVRTLLNPQPVQTVIEANMLQDAPTATVAFQPMRIVELVREGFPLRELEELNKALNLNIEQLAAKIGISKATFHRRKTEGRLTADESDRVVRYARLIGQATALFGDAEGARQWFSAPQYGLNGATPLDYAETEAGGREVEKLLGRIEHSVYA